MRLPRRYDDMLMHPPVEGGEADPVLLARLRAWCETGAFPVPVEPLRVASIAPHPALDAAACVLDGSHKLARLGHWRGLGWRLQILWREHVSRRQPGPGDPWDCGWWRAGPPGAAKAFAPRRATLLMLRDPAPAVVAELLPVLNECSPGYALPVRVLVVSAVVFPGLARI